VAAVEPATSAVPSTVAIAPAAVDAPLPAAVSASLPPQSSGSAAASNASAIAGGDAQSAINDVLGRYRSAFGALDPAAVREVWPTVNQRTLEKAFRQLQQQDVAFFSCRLEVRGDLADAECVGTTTFVPKVGNRSPQSGPSQWNFSLSKGGRGTWQIEDVQAQ